MAAIDAPALNSQCKQVTNDRPSRSHFIMRQPGKDAARHENCDGWSRTSIMLRGNESDSGKNLIRKSCFLEEQRPPKHDATRSPSTIDGNTLSLPFIFHGAKPKICPILCVIVLFEKIALNRFERNQD
uniref:Uncharacterized protein n=1 Tax=Heterorhabditis bacteriophora TaxID=37862 RepID=A0A1I7WT78_HETBA